MDLVVLLGPQGAGNHLFSKLFALDPDVDGWKDLVTEGWLGHDKEPWHEYWTKPEKFRDLRPTRHAVTSMSIPYMRDGTKQIPDVQAFLAAASQVFCVKPVLIGRDSNILREQQQRLRGEQTYRAALDHLQHVKPAAFASTELVYLYRQQYLANLSALLDFPIAYNDPRVNDILADDPNTKYVTAGTAGPWEEHARRSSGFV